MKNSTKIVMFMLINCSVISASNLWNNLTDTAKEITQDLDKKASISARVSHLESYFYSSYNSSTENEGEYTCKATAMGCIDNIQNSFESRKQVYLTKKNDDEAHCDVKLTENENGTKGAIITVTDAQNKIVRQAVLAILTEGSNVALHYKSSKRSYTQPLLSRFFYGKI